VVAVERGRKDLLALLDPLAPGVERQVALGFGPPALFVGFKGRFRAVLKDEIVAARSVGLEGGDQLELRARLPAAALGLCSGCGWSAGGSQGVCFRSLDGGVRNLRGPWLHPGVELAKVRLLGLARDEDRLVLGGNLLRLIERVRRQANTSLVAAVRTASPPLPDGRDPWAGEQFPGVI
jgi:hypothetical protein